MSVAPRSPQGVSRADAGLRRHPARHRRRVLVAPYNDLATTEALIDAHHDELAAVIVEPYQRTIPPASGFSRACAARPRATGCRSCSMRS